jgi:transposase
MRTSAARSEYSREGVLFLAIETSAKSWKIGTKSQLGQRMREKTIAAWDKAAFWAEVKRAKECWGLDPEVRVVGCYEAGRDGFSVHRFLTALGVEDDVVDPGSIKVAKKGGAKTDRIDLRGMLDDRIRTFEGEERWSTCRVPTLEQEDGRQLHRELVTLKTERTRHRNRIRSLLATMGVRAEVGEKFGEQLSKVRCFDGSVLPPGLQARLEREWTRLKLVQEQIAILREERRREVRASAECQEPVLKPVRELAKLVGIGEEGSWRLGRELFSWRRFENRRQLAALAGLAPTPFRSGTIDQDLGVPPVGSRWIRPLMIELSWRWLQYQPKSELSRWYQSRFGSGRRSRKVGIVALARKLLIALWRYLETGLPPAGARLKA